MSEQPPPLPPTPATASASAPRGRWWIAGTAVLVALAGAVAWGETVGWPFLASPLQRLLSQRLDRPVRFSTAAEQGSASLPALRVRFIGGIHLQTAQLEVAAPVWSQAPHLLLAQDLTLELRYRDLWRAQRGERLRIHRLKARQLDAHLERLADGRASWSFRPNEPMTGAAPLPPPLVGQLQVNQGSVRFHDVPTGVDVLANLSLQDGEGAAAVLRADASGRYRNFPVKLELVASGLLPWEAEDDHSAPSALTLKATLGRASLAFDGSAIDVMQLRGMTGRFSLKGPSLAAVGDPVGVTLPATPAFRSNGMVVKQGAIWRVVVDDATVGTSQLNGAFSYDTGRSVPLLAGRLGGKRLALADLGPAVGVAPAGEPGNGVSKSGVKGKGKDKVLPDRPFDLPSMRAMDANVLIDIAEVDLNTSLLEPLKPLHTHLVLAGGVLSLNAIDARTADGRLAGNVRLDGRAATALWSADVRWNAVRLERWIRQARANSAPPYISGRLDGTATVQGQGRSTADILASLKGKVHTELRSGAVSHLVVEAAGLDIAEGLGLLISGDDALPIPCAVADLVAVGGVFRPRLVVLDTKDSVIWIDGSVSMADETLDLRAIVAPKDFSLLTLRTPLRVHGSFANPEVSLQKDAIGRKLGASVLLGLLNPLAALIPLFDTGDSQAASKGAAECQSLRQRGVTQAAAARGKAAASGAARVRSPAK